MSYPLGTISSLSGGNLIVNGSSTTYFSVLSEGDEVTLNEQTVEVSSSTNDLKFTVKTAFTSGASGDILYAVSKCVWLRYQIRKIDMAIANYDFNLLGVDEASNGTDKLKFNYQNTPISQLRSLRADYKQQLTECEAEENGTSIWIVRRLEYGTL